MPLKLSAIGDQLSLRGCARGRLFSSTPPILPVTLFDVTSSLLQLPTLTRGRIRAAYGAAVLTDGLQFLAGPLGWVFFDQVLDVAAAVLMWRLLGFHPLLLPTFVVEFLPVADLLPTWTGCVAVVVALRKRQQRTAPSQSQATVIDV
jgi:hypothetical protein